MTKWQYATLVAAPGGTIWLVIGSPGSRLTASADEWPDMVAKAGLDGWEALSVQSVSQSPRVTHWTFKRPVLSDRPGAET